MLARLLLRLLPAYTKKNLFVTLKPKFVCSKRNEGMRPIEFQNFKVFQIVYRLCSFSDCL